MEQDISFVSDGEAGAKLERLSASDIAQPTTWDIPTKVEINLTVRDEIESNRNFEVLDKLRSQSLAELSIMNDDRVGYYNSIHFLKYFNEAIMTNTSLETLIFVMKVIRGNSRLHI